jgi:hypothetical protein
VTRKAVVAVRLPGARMAPINKTWIGCHTRFVHTEAKVVIKSANALGAIGIGDLP